MNSWNPRVRLTKRGWLVGLIALPTLLLAGYGLRGDAVLLALGGIVIGAEATALCLGQKQDWREALKFAQPSRQQGESMDLPLTMIDYVQAVDVRLATNERQMDLEREEARRIAYELQRLTDTVRRAATSDNVLPLVKDIFAHSFESYGAVITELWLEEAWKSALGNTGHSGQSLASHTPRGRPAVLVAAHGAGHTDSSVSHSRGAPVLGVIDSCYRLTACDEQSLGWLFDRDWLASREIRSFASFPLTIRGECIGVFAIFSKDMLSEVFLGVLECCAQVLALALADQRSLIDSRQIASKLETANTRQHEINNHLAETDRLKSEFLCTVSHELRTPLTKIQGFLGLLKNGLANN
ncbi:MAG: histidine kinase dimerization/phospho-acceptor domain-containing protein, partial [Armatimonadota bacterium]